MSIKVGYHWHLRQVMAEAGLFATRTWCRCWRSATSRCLVNRSTVWLPRSLSVSR